MSPAPGVIGAYGRSSFSAPVAGMRAWYDASKESYANNDPVGVWQNWSTQGSGFNALSSTTLRPTFKTNVLNGRPALDFDGTDDELQAGVVMFPTGYKHTAFIVLADMGTAGTLPQQDILFDTPTNGALSRRVAQYYITGGQAKLQFARDGSGGSTALNVTAGEDIIFAVVTDGASSLLRLNGDAGRQSTFAVSTNTTASDIGFFIGRSGVSATDYYTGRMCEMIIYPTALSSGDFSYNESYLKSKYGIA